MVLHFAVVAATTGERRRYQFPRQLPEHLRREDNRCEDEGQSRKNSSGRIGELFMMLEHGIYLRRSLGELPGSFAGRSSEEGTERSHQH